MFYGNYLLQVASIAVFAQAGMPDQFAIPDAMQVARIIATLGRAEHGNWNVVASARVCRGVERLAKVADKMNQKLEGLAAGREGLFRVTQDPGKLIDLGHDAVVFGAVFWFVPGRIRGNIDVVPGSGFRPRAADVVRPGGDGRQIVVAQKLSQLLQRGLVEVVPRIIGNDAVAFVSPGPRL